MITSRTCNIMNHYMAPVERPSCGEAVLWRDRPVERPSCGETVLWRGRPVERPSCGEAVLWRGRPVERSSCGEAVLWRGRPVERPSCGEVVLWRGRLDPAEQCVHWLKHVWCIRVNLNSLHVCLVTKCRPARPVSVYSILLVTSKWAEDQWGTQGLVGWISRDRPFTAGVKTQAYHSSYTSGMSFAMAGWMAAWPALSS